MSRKWEGRPGLALAALVAGVFALILLISVSSPAVAGSGSMVHTLDLPISVADRLPSC
jgi:signal peptidase I